MPDVLDIWKQDWGAEMISALQEEVIRHVMRRRDALVVMPRGDDRALCFQVPSMLMNGLVLVVSPRCRERMVDRKVLYIRPERLTKALKWLHGRDVGLFVVDEAQCLCSWRQDYERSYECLGLLRRKFPWAPILALTDVSDDLTQNYLFSQLWLKGWTVFEEGREG